MTILDDIENCLLEDRREGRLHGEAGPTDAAIATCKGIMGWVSPFDLLPSRLKWAAFGEAAGSVSLVARSPVTDRRVDFRISPDGRSVSAFCFDENLRADSILLNGVRCLDRIMQWLNDSWRIGCTASTAPGGSIAPPGPVESFRDAENAPSNKGAIDGPHKPIG